MAGQQPEQDPVAIERVGPVCILRLRRPATRNALDTLMLRAVERHLRDAAGDDAVRAVVIAGSDGIFASGANIPELRDTEPIEYLTSSRQAAWASIEAFPKPSVAAVEGFALGGGCELALRCDAIVAGDGAVFGQPEVRLGIVAGSGGVQWWTRVAGRFAATSVLLAGDRVGAYEARRLGIVSRVVPDEAVTQGAVELASSMAEGGPRALDLTKEMMRGAYEAPLTQAMIRDRSALAVTLSTEDHREGMNAVLERRTPRFEGR